MKQIVVLFFIFILILTSGCYQVSTIYFAENESTGKPNLLKNPGFEKSLPRNTYMPDYWLLLSRTPEYVEPVGVDSTVASEGRNSFRIHHSSKELILVSDAFRINPQGGFYIKCSTKAAKPLNNSLKLRFLTFDKAGNRKNRFSVSMKVGQDWKQSAISAGFLSNSADFARVLVTIPRIADNTVWLDDLGVYQVHVFEKE